LRPTKPATAVPGVIDTLSGGFDRVNRIPWILGFPILLDVILWLAPRLSGAPVFHRLATSLSDLYGSVATTGLDDTTVKFMRERIADFDTNAATFNLLFLIPTSLAPIPTIEPSSITGSFSLELTSGEVLLAVVIGFALLGTLFGCFFRGILAQQVRDGKVNAVALARRVPFYFISVLGFVLLAIGAIVAILIPLGIVIGLISLVSPTIGVLVLSATGAAANVFAFLVVIYLYFWVDAVVVSGVGPLRAAVNSGRVVANNFWSTILFIGLVLVISQGTSLIWNALDQIPIGMVIAIAANAYIATGLTAASMIFYQTRVARLPAASGVLGRVTQA
jgi:hypothetical protein